MQTSKDRQRLLVNLWTARAVPVVLAGVVGYATYVLVARLSGLSSGPLIIPTTD